jgi:hypothetical protein
VSKTISTKNKNKSVDYLNIVADFFIDANIFISQYCCILFNKIFETGIYPEAFCKGIIVSIYKKGDPENPSSYRGIIVLQQIFCLVLRNRLYKWCESEHIFNDVQFGFRYSRSTAYAFFILHSHIHKMLDNKSNYILYFHRF